MKENKEQRYERRKKEWEEEIFLGLFSFFVFLFGKNFSFFIGGKGGGNYAAPRKQKRKNKKQKKTSPLFSSSILLHSSSPASSLRLLEIQRHSLQARIETCATILSLEKHQIHHDVFSAGGCILWPQLVLHYSDPQCVPLVLRGHLCLCQWPSFPSSFSFKSLFSPSFSSS